MNRAFEKELSRALATELDTAAPKTLLRRCRAEHIVKQRSDWRDLLHCQFKLLGWKVISGTKSGLVNATSSVPICK